MSSYTSVDLNPTEGQLMDLSEGNAVKLAPKNMHGDVTFHLTKGQLARVLAAQAAGKGMTLKFSKAQIRHMGQHGSGRFSDMLKSGLNLLKPALQAGAKSVVDIGKNYAEKGAAQLLDKGADFVKSKIGGSITAKDLNVLRAIEKKHGRGFFGDMIKTIAHGGIDFLGNKLGVGLQPPLWSSITPSQRKALESMHVKLGSGFFGDLIKTVAHGGVDFLGNKLGFGVGGTIVSLERPRKPSTMCQHCYQSSQAGGEINPLIDGNEDLRASIYQKKVVLPSGEGLRV